MEAKVRTARDRNSRRKQAGRCSGTRCWKYLSAQFLINPPIKGTLHDGRFLCLLVPQLRWSWAREIFQKALIPVCVQVDANDESSFWEQRSPIFCSGRGQYPAPKGRTDSSHVEGESMPAISLRRGPSIMRAKSARSLPHRVCHRSSWRYRQAALRVPGRSFSSQCPGPCKW